MVRIYHLYTQINFETLPNYESRLWETKEHAHKAMIMKSLSFIFIKSQYN